VQGRDGEPGVLEGSAGRTEAVQGVDDRVEHAAARIAPARRVQRHREFAVSVLVEGVKSLGERQQIGVVAQPSREKVP